jgi:hypothetical protein
MNQKGATFFIAIIFAVMIFVAGMLILNFMKDDISAVTSSTALDCNNQTITDGNKVACLGMDIAIPYFFILVLSAAGGIIAAKLAL